MRWRPDTHTEDLGRYDRGAGIWSKDCLSHGWGRYEVEPSDRGVTSTPNGIERQRETIQDAQTDHEPSIGSWR